MTVATTYPGMTAKGLQTASATVGWASAHQSTSKNEKKRWAEAHPTILPEARPAIIYASVYCSNCLLGNDGQWASDGIRRHLLPAGKTVCRITVQTRP
ncbi:TPA: hypothetical protein ACFNMW_002004, partial [Neisseria lactamica]